jgi:hypothetical protein
MDPYTPPPLSAAKLKVRHLKLLAYLSATRERYDGFRDARCGLRPVMEAGETDKLLGAVERHRRDPQTGGGLALPLEVVIDVLSYLPPERGTFGQTKEYNGNARTSIARVMQTCTLMLFLVMENGNVLRPPARGALACEVSRCRRRVDSGRLDVDAAARVDAASDNERSADTVEYRMDIA